MKSFKDLHGTDRWLFIGFFVCIAIALVVVVIAATGVSGSSGEETGGVEPQPKVISERVIYDPGKVKKGNIKHSQRKTGGGKTSARRIAARSGTGPCYVVNETRYGNSGTWQKVVSGTGHFHWCVAAANHAKIAKYWSNFDFDDNWLLGWTLEWSKIDKDSDIAWTSTWCSDDGSGPCYNVQRKTREYRWQFVRSVYVPILDKIVDQHATFYAICTVRGDAPTRTWNHECYSGWVH